MVWSGQFISKPFQGRKVISDHQVLTVDARTAGSYWSALGWPTFGRRALRFVHTVLGKEAWEFRTIRTTIFKVEYFRQELRYK